MKLTPPALYFGMSTSPLIVDDKVIVLSGEPPPPMKGVTNKTALAYHKATGERIWSAMDDKQLTPRRCSSRWRAATAADFSPRSASSA